MESVVSHRRTLLWVSLIVLLGLGIRLAGLFWGQGYCSIGPSDALEAYQFAVDYTVGEPRAQYLGQPNYNDHAKLPGPLWTLFCVNGLHLTGSADGVVLELVLVNTAAIVLIYLLARRTLGPKAALWAALLGATLPFPIYYSVSIYNPNVMMFLGAALYLALWSVIRHERSRAVFWLPFLVLLMPQFHMCVTMLLPALALILLLARPRVHWPWLLAGLAAGLLLYIPYINGDMHHGWQNTLGMTQSRSGYRPGGFKALTAPLSLLTNWVPQWTWDFAGYRQLGKACFGWSGLLFAANLLSAVVGVLLVGRAAVEVKRALGRCEVGIAKGEGNPNAERRVESRFWACFRTSQLALRTSPPEPGTERAAGWLFLAIIVVVPLLLAGFSGKNFRTHYALVVVPALLTLTGGAAVQWMTSPRVGRTFTAALVVLTCANVWFMTAMFHDQGARINRGPTFVGSFRHMEQVYQSLRQHAGPGQRVQVEDHAYLQQFTRAQRERKDEKMIRLYVAIREKSFAAQTGNTNAPVCYEMCKAETVTPEDGTVAFRGNGIVLKKVSAQD